MAMEEALVSMTMEEDVEEEEEGFSWDEDLVGEAGSHLQGALMRGLAVEDGSQPSDLEDICTALSRLVITPIIQIRLFSSFL